MMKSRSSFILRVMGMCGICICICIVVFLINNKSIHSYAEILFVGTNDDADCTIITNKNFCIVVDSGEALDAQRILNLLQEKEIDTINCLVFTHPDSDHIGGGPKILAEVGVEQILVPYYDGNSSKYHNLIKQAEKQNIPVVILNRNRNLVFGDLKMDVFVPQKDHYEKTNDYSLATLIRHGDITIFMAGDAQEERLKEFKTIRFPEKIDLYKTAYHGRKSKEGINLIEKISPMYAVVTGTDVDLGIKKAFQTEETEVYYSVMEDVLFRSDGVTLKKI